MEDECLSGLSHPDEAGGTLSPCAPCSRDFPLMGPSGVQSLRHSQLRKRYLITRGAQGAIYAACDMLHPDRPREVIVKRLYPQQESPYGSQGFAISILRESTLLNYISGEQERIRADSEAVKVMKEEGTAIPPPSFSISTITSSLEQPRDEEQGGSRVALTSVTPPPPPSPSVSSQEQIDESARIIELYRIVEAPFGEICLVLESCDMNLEHLYLPTSQLPSRTRDRAPDDNEERYSVGETPPMQSNGVFHALFDEQVPEPNGEEVDRHAGCPGMRKGRVVDFSFDSSLPNMEEGTHLGEKGRIREKTGWKAKKWRDEDSHSKERENSRFHSTEGRTGEHWNACVRDFGCSAQDVEENHPVDENGEKEEVVGKRWMERLPVKEGKTGYPFAYQLAPRELFPLFDEEGREGDGEVLVHGRVHEEKKPILSSLRSPRRSSSLSSSSTTTTTTSSCFSFFKGAISTIEAPQDDPLHLKSTERLGLSGNRSGGVVLQYFHGAMGVSSEWQNARHAMIMKAGGGGGIEIRGLSPSPSSCGEERGPGDCCPVLRELPLIRYLMRRLLRVLCFLHETCHVCHRDIKPSNWLIKIPKKGEEGGGGIRLGDFGSACIIPHNDSRAKREETALKVDAEEEEEGMVREAKEVRNVAQGGGKMEVEEGTSTSLELPPLPLPLTPGTFRMTRTYMAPECILGEDYGFKADIWSVGVTFIELVLQRRLFWSISEVGVLSEIYSLLVEDSCEEEEEAKGRRSNHREGEEEGKEKKKDRQDLSTCGVEDETKEENDASRPCFTKLSTLIKPFLPPEGVEFAHSLLKLKQQQRLSASEALSHLFLKFDGWKEEDALGEEIWRKKLGSMA